MGCTPPVPSSSFTLSCCKLHYLVRVAFVSCRRDGRECHFGQKNTMVLAHFHSQSLSWPRWLPDAPDASQMLPRCLQDESQMSQMPPRCFACLLACLQQPAPAGTAPGGSQVSQMSPRDVSQMPPRCFLDVFRCHESQLRISSQRSELKGFSEGVLARDLSPGISAKISAKGYQPRVFSQVC